MNTCVEPLHSQFKNPCMTGKQPFDKDLAHYIYILVRRDLSLAQQTVQAIHAGIAANHRFGGLKSDTRLALLAVESQTDLKHWMGRLEEKGIEFEPFFEPDHDTGWSALATSPITSKKARCFSKLPLWSPKMIEYLDESQFVDIASPF